MQNIRPIFHPLFSNTHNYAKFMAVEGQLWYGVAYLRTRR